MYKEKNYVVELDVLKLECLIGKAIKVGLNNDDIVRMINSKISDIEDLATREEIEKMSPYNKDGKLKTKKLSDRHFNLLRYAQGDNEMLEALGVEW